MQTKLNKTHKLVLKEQQRRKKLIAKQQLEKSQWDRFQDWDNDRVSLKDLSNENISIYVRS